MASEREGRKQEPLLPRTELLPSGKSLSHTEAQNELKQHAIPVPLF